MCGLLGTRDVMIVCYVETNSNLNNFQLDKANLILRIRASLRKELDDGKKTVLKVTDARENTSRVVCGYAGGYRFISLTH